MRDLKVTLSGTKVGPVEFSSKKLGVGLFNAITSQNSQVLVRDGGDGSLRLIEVKIEWPSKYVSSNVLYFEQAIPDNISELAKRFPGVNRNDWLVGFSTIATDNADLGKVTGTLTATCEAFLNGHLSEFQLECPLVGWVAVD